MPRTDPSGCFSGFKPGWGVAKPPRRERPQQLACDRCRGQKLRCIRTPNPSASCERCQKAGATCIIDSSVRMGRPKRTDKEQRDTTGGSSQHNPPQLTPSPALAPSSTHTLSGGFTPNGESWPGHDFDDTVDPALGGMQYMVSFDFALQDAALEEDVLDIPPEHYPGPNLNLSMNHSIPALTDEVAATDTATVHMYSRSPSMRQESTQELSNLNLELYRQLGVVGPIASKYKNPHLGGPITPPEGNHCLSDAVVFMMHGLQTYHRLLLEILGSTGPTHDTMHDLDEHPKPDTTSLLSPADGRDGDDARDPMSKARGRQPQEVTRPHSSAELTVLHDMSHRAPLDMPTSLLLLSCHTNLIYLCRDVFAAIRAALLAKRHQMSLFTFSILHTDEVSIPQDPDLQIIVLTQSVVRLADRIGRLLGYPDTCEVDYGGKRCEAKDHGNAISPQLLDLVLGGEASGRVPADRVGMEALRAEIRKLHELVYKTV